MGRQVEREAGRWRWGAGHVPEGQAGCEGLASVAEGQAHLAFAGQPQLCPFPANHSLDASSHTKAFNKCLLYADTVAGRVEVRGKRPSC